MSRIVLDGVTKRFGPLTALDHLDLAVDEGEFLTILGPSGSGKTTILNIVAGLIPPSEGRITIGASDVTHAPASKRNVGLVFQSYALFPHMNVEANVSFPLRVRGVDKRETAERVQQALKLVRLDGYQKRKPNALSGGQQQRVALARAFVFEPAMLLLDEPLAALDRKLREEVQVELRQLQRSLGITTLLVTHDQEEALSMSDRLAVLGDGQLQQVGTPEEVYLRPSSRFVADFLGTANILDGTVRRRTGGSSVVLPDGRSVPFEGFTSTDGTRVQLMLRPERLRVVASTEGDGLAAELVEAIYLGKFVRYHARLRDGTPIVASSTDVIPAYRPGDHVNVTWDPADAWVLPDSNPTFSTSTPNADSTVAAH